MCMSLVLGDLYKFVKRWTALVRVLARRRGSVNPPIEDLESTIRDRIRHNPSGILSASDHKRKKPQAIASKQTPVDLTRLKKKEGNTNKISKTDGKKGTER